MLDECSCPRGDPAGIVGPVLTAGYRELLTAVAGSSAALTGLLFVAISVRPGSTAGGMPPVIRQVRAATSLLAFTNTLVVSLFGLIPDENDGRPAVVVGIIGILFTAASVRSMVADKAVSRYLLLRQAGLVMLLLAAFCVELGAGIVLISSPDSRGAAELLCNIVVGLVIIGIARAWELVGDRDTGIFASLAVLAGRTRDVRQPLPPSAPNPPPSNRVPPAGD
jgi:hypothetical protein